MSIISLLTGCTEEFQRVDAYPFRKTDFALPYLSACAALAIGEALGFAAAPACSWWPLSMTLLLLFVLFGYGWRVPHWHYFGLFLLGFALALYAESRRARIFDRCDYSSSPLSAEFPVCGWVRSSERYLSFDSSVGGVDVRVVIRKPHPQIPIVGEVWCCSGWLERKDREDRHRRTLWVSGCGSSAARVRASSLATHSLRLQKLRERLSANIGYGLAHDPLAADLIRAMVLGLRASLPRQARQMFADAGTVHVFAISGLHVGVVAWLMVHLMMAVCCFPLRWVALLLAPLLTAYVLMIDAPPSAVRAAVMSVVYFVAPMFFRHSDSLVSWSVTFMGFHILNPEMLMNVGSLLSFTVMLGILLHCRWTEVFKCEWLLNGGVSTAAWLSGFAISAHVFERITFGGLLANVAAIPLASLAVVMGFLGSTTGFLWPWLSSHFNNAAALLVRAMSGISWLAGEMPCANFAIVPWSLWMCFAWYADLVMSLLLIRSVYLRRHRMI